MGQINDLQIQIFKNAIEKGFRTGKSFDRNFGEMIALTHGELSEALEADRSDNYALVPVNGFLHLTDEEFKKEFEARFKDTVDDELADTVIRILDIAEDREISLEWHIIAKMRYNSLRPYKHGKKY